MIPPIQLLCEKQPLLQEEKTSILGRCWTVVKRVSRRYSVVASEVSLLALNLLFLTCKANDDIPDEVGEITLALLSTIGILSLHYSADTIWKAVQDARFAKKMRNRHIAILSIMNVMQQTSNVALLLGNFTAGAFGAIGKEKTQMKIYRDMTLWGEISIGTGLLLTLISLYVTRRTLKKMSPNEKFVADLRFCMDKDTLWHLIDKLEKIDPEDTESLYEAIQVVKKNIDTQYKVTLGGRLALIVVGDVLQGVGKVYTPNSLVSASINASVSVAYAIKIVVEKALEYRQRAQLDQNLPSDTFDYLVN